MMRTPSSVKAGVAAVALIVATGCARETWPEPPAVEQAQYRAEHDRWLAEQQETIAFALPIAGIWTIEQGETPFGTDSSLPIVLPAAAGAARAGVIRRAGDQATIVPAQGVVLRSPDGMVIAGETGIDNPVVVGRIQLEYGGGGDGRLFVTARDLDHPAVTSTPSPEAYAVDPRWRVSARFDAYDAPKIVKIADVRGGSSDVPAVGQLVFRIDGREMHLTALESGEGRFFVMFKDATNGKTTYRGYRMLGPTAVKNGEWTVLDFNFASNPPCAYSSFTVCPLPPRENRLDVAVEAGLKQLPSVEGWTAG
jgi:uncharacterized protein (DUF1684 family)